METQTIKQQFEQILAEVLKIRDISPETATHIATVILQETGKFKRTEMLSQSRQRYNSDNGNKPATDKQKQALRNLGIQHDSNIGKSEAYRLIEGAVQRIRTSNNSEASNAASK